MIGNGFAVAGASDDPVIGAPSHPFRLGRVGGVRSPLTTTVIQPV